MIANAQHAQRMLSVWVLFARMRARVDVLCLRRLASEFVEERESERARARARARARERHTNTHKKGWQYRHLGLHVGARSNLLRGCGQTVKEHPQLICREGL